MRYPLIAVVGVCAVGKSTLVSGLRKKGFWAVEVAQEHSEVPYLWARHHPEAMIYLSADDDVITPRRDYITPQKLKRQRQLLSYARDNADVFIDATSLGIPEVLSRAKNELERQGIDAGASFKAEAKK